jgi:hypothetical protein
MALDTPAHWLRRFTDRCAWLESEDHVFAALGSEIMATTERLQGKRPDVDLRTHEGFSASMAWWADALHVRIGDLLGCAFVLAQRQISSVVSNVKRIHTKLGERSLAPPPLSRSKAELVARDRRVKAIDAAANYFKHRDEWPAGAWPSSVLSDMQRRTVRTLVGHGAHPWRNGSGNLVVIARSVGIRGGDLRPLVEHTVRWALGIRDAIAADFVTRGLAEDTQWWREPFWITAPPGYTRPPD